MAAIFSNKYILPATDGPIPNANIIVPTPTIPPKFHPIIITVNSIPLLTQAIGKFVIRCNPVIKPSLGPGPKLEIKYNAPPKPVINTPAVASASCAKGLSKVGRRGNIYSNTNEIIIAFKMVPIPGICLSGIQQKRTIKLSMNVENPILQLVT